MINITTDYITGASLGYGTMGNKCRELLAHTHTHTVEGGRLLVCLCGVAAVTLTVAILALEHQFTDMPPPLHTAMIPRSYYHHTHTHTHCWDPLTCSDPIYFSHKSYVLLCMETALSPFDVPHFCADVYSLHHTHTFIQASSVCRSETHQ